ncbi:M20 family metallopeptidase [Ammoniphilus sp. CFH 90114]|uniref:M20 family metallopeptidase n=1 Tax=Ammoniphilus sp. CFH 90114 TaxID=2493665 RepID=UPI0013E8F60A|nr:M20/M25/M40 family metallo-hydrolase [Ammoniphilus sp. CFH 90114]
MLCKRNKIELKGDLIFTAVVGEEGRSEGTERLVLEGIHADRAIVGEPSQFDYAIGHRGLEWIEIHVKGKIAHSGVAETGVNAISKAAQFIVELEKELGPKLKERNNPYTGPSILNFGRIDGGTQPSTVADQCTIQLDRRYVRGESVEDVIGEIQAVINRLSGEDASFQATCRPMAANQMNHLYHVPMLTDPKDPLVHVLHNSIRKVTSHNPKISTKRGWTDGGLISHYAKIPTVICGPGDIAYSHSRNEKIEIKQLEHAVRIYLQTAIDFCQ